MQTTAMVAVWWAVTVTDNGCEQVCTRSRPESVTVTARHTATIAVVCIVL